MLITETNSRSAERKVRRAFRGFLGRNARDFATVYEHGQWWVIYGPCIWSACDSIGPRSCDGLCFERVD